MALSWNQRLLLAKAETTYGVSASPTGSDALFVRSLEVKPLEGSIVKREVVRPYFGAMPQLMAGKHSMVTFEVELSGSGTAGTAPKYGPLIEACGFSSATVASTSVTYSPVSTGIGSQTLSFHVAGVKHLITGARGTFELSGKVNEIPVLKFTFTGIYNTATDTANPTPTYNNQAQPLVVDSTATPTFNVFGYSGCLEEFSLDVGNDVTFRNLAGCTKQALITQRDAKGSLSIEATTIAAKDFWTAAANSTAGAITIGHGTTAGNIVTLNVPNAISSAPEYKDSNNITMLSLPFVAPPSSGNDDLTLVFS